MRENAASRNVEICNLQFLQRKNIKSFFVALAIVCVAVIGGTIIYRNSQKKHCRHPCLITEVPEKDKPAPGGGHGGGGGMEGMGGY